MYQAWWPHWNASASVLMDKSPMHIVMTRLLQHWFTPQQSYFIVLIRHPLAPLRKHFDAYVKDGSCIHGDKQPRGCDCGEAYVAAWLQLMRELVMDLQHLRHIAVIYYEHLTSQSTQGLPRALAIIGADINIFKQATSTPCSALLGCHRRCR